MPKFYVKSGELERVLNAESGLDACTSSLSDFIKTEGKDRKTHTEMFVSEVGFRDQKSKDVDTFEVYEIEEILDEISLRELML